MIYVLKNEDLYSVFSWAINIPVIIAMCITPMLVEKMKGLSPLEKLNQGYAYVEDKKGRPVRQIADVKEGDAIRIYVSDGMIEAQVKGMTEEIQYHA